ncbi:hypothetical protein KOAAANKH_00721 [Brevundimonas sp. NIBR10]|uniref:hypothetical protein n=1 Tax=Brevundimonas sp. NIBR10 TaxID=3015997 RepID=UPI0022F175A4|nr:hypothetical protein [Brevundimonas sp. NIBR10]WGM45857.1 hypothetical protein KOAAANKH_00721 [Brevundimonas sp. NIBR10]
MRYPVPSEVLKHAREADKQSLARLAETMKTVASVLSKQERAVETDPEMAERYLSAVGTPLAAEILAYYARPWTQEPPSFLHPDAETLWTIDEALASLETFEADNPEPVLRGPIGLLRDDLHATWIYLKRQDHTVAWVGDIGVGKTTALTHAVGLLVGDGRSGRKPAFPVGSGRVTVCETAVKASPTFGVLVDPEDDDEVARLTRDMVASLKPDSGALGPSAEVARVLRNMSGTRDFPVIINDEPVMQDPIKDLLEGGLGVDETTDRLIAAMTLSERRERQVILPEGSEDGLSWVSKRVSAINNGLDRQFTLPKRITVLMPSSRLSAEGQQLQVIDTRGVEGLTQRKDLIDHDQERRTLMVLCTKFADAPAPTVQRLLQDSVDAFSGAVDRRRKCILVLPRGDEALDVPGMDADVATRQLGYAIRRKDIEQALVKAGLPATPAYFFDARNDDPDKIWATLRGQITQMRAVYGDRAAKAAAGVAHLRENPHDVLAEQARHDVSVELDTVLTLADRLGDSVRPAYQNLVDQMAVGHHSSIAASIARRGDWSAFDFAEILGQGVRIDANARTQREATRLELKIEELENRWANVVSVRQTLESLRTKLADSRQGFLTSARTIGREAYADLLSGQSDIWALTADRYGRGAGYKRDVAADWRRWFVETPEAADTAAAISQRLMEAWRWWVIEALRRSAQPTPE